MNYSFHPEAEPEFEDAINYYEEASKDLGHDFAVEVYSAIQRAATYPFAWPVIHDEVRRCLTRRFPYGVLYSTERTGIYILAIMHLHRSPDYWRDRK